MVQQLTILFTALAALITTVVGSYWAWRKWGPERRSVEVTTANSVDEIVVKFATQASANVTLHAEVADLRNQLGSLRREMQTKIDGLYNDLAHERGQRRMSNAYARTLAEVLRDHDMPVPEPPDGLDID